MGYSAVDIARYVINYSHEIEHPVSNLKLQKLLYFLQGFFLIIKGKVCFDDEIEAWGFGPVVSSVYHEFKGYGSNDIPKIVKYFDYNEFNPQESSIKTFDDSFIDEEDKKLINQIIDLFKNYSASSLVEMTHEKNGPWDITYKQGEKHTKIDKECIRTYFSKRYSNESK